MKSHSPPWICPRAAYVHVPFCAHQCGYCDFAIAVGQDDLIDQYVEALIREMELLLKQPLCVETIFLGGGTPTYLNHQQLDRLLAAIQHWLPLTTDNEFSIEANPDTLDKAKMDLLAERGINRVSLGAQSFHSHLLKALDRLHVVDDIEQCLAFMRPKMDSLSVDLIFGIPGQSIQDWRGDLQRALDLKTDHLSTYGLTYEKGTPLWKSRRRGDVIPLTEDDELAMYKEAIDFLLESGFEHYEISNFARPGKRSRHNETYWANEAYFGFGMGAARYVEGRRELNVRNLQGYLSRIEAGESATFQSERLEGEERARETMAVQLRRAEGIERERFREQTGIDLNTLAGTLMERQCEQGFLQDDGQRVRLTAKGKFVADAVIERLM